MTTYSGKTLECGRSVPPPAGPTGRLSMSRLGGCSLLCLAIDEVNAQAVWMQTGGSQIQRLPPVCALGVEIPAGGTARGSLSSPLAKTQDKEKSCTLQCRSLQTVSLRRRL